MLVRVFRRFLLVLHLSAHRHGASEYVFTILFVPWLQAFPGITQFASRYMCFGFELVHHLYSFYCVVVSLPFAWTMLVRVFRRFCFLAWILHLHTHILERHRAAEQELYTEARFIALLVSPPGFKWYHRVFVLSTLLLTFRSGGIFQSFAQTMLDRTGSIEGCVLNPHPVSGVPHSQNLVSGFPALLYSPYQFRQSRLWQPSF